MSLILITYSLIFYSFIRDISMFYYTGFSAILLFSFWHLTKNKVKIEKLFAFYLVFAPLYNFYIVMRFWHVSSASFVWLIPIPFAAYIFFNNRIVLYYIIYTFFIIILNLIVIEFFDFDFPQKPLDRVKISDVFLIIVNVFLIAFLVYYKAKIRELEIITEIEEKEKISLPLSLDDKDVQMFDNLFEKIEDYIVKKENFKDSNITISIVSTNININNNYISRAIRLKGFTNFNHYVNSARINHAKMLLNSKDMNKVTFLYIYSESGFTSQSTFNRVFKQIEGKTPSEFLHLKENTNSSLL